MKIQFEEDIESVPVTEGLDVQSTDKENLSPEIAEMLDEGIAAAQSGDRAEARSILLKVTEEDPKSETAWLWLASISEYPEELLIFLNNVLKLNPENERAVKWASETKVLLAKTFVQRGIDAEKDGQNEFAKQCFLQAIVHDDQSELAWLWLASVSDSDDEKIAHLKKVININPENESALGSLERAYERVGKALLAEAKSSFYDGERERASKLVEECLANDPALEEALLLKSELEEDVDEKIACLEKVLEINPENQSAKASIETAKYDRIVSSLSKAKVAIDEGNNDEATSLLDEILEDAPNVIDAWLLKADIADSPDEKVECYNKVLATDPENSFALEGVEKQRVVKARQLVDEAKDAVSEGLVDSAEKMIDEALAEVPDMEEALLVKCDLAESAEAKRELLDAVLEQNPNCAEALEQVKELEKETVERLLEDAQAAYDSDETSIARELVENALKLDADNEKALLLNAELVPLVEKESVLNRVLELNPDNKEAKSAVQRLEQDRVKALFAKASTAATSGDKAGAEELLQKVIQSDPEMEEAWLLRAHLADAFDKKIESFEKVLEINPDNAAASASLQSLEAIVQNSEADNSPDEPQTDEVIEAEVFEADDEEEVTVSFSSADFADEAGVSDDAGIEAEAVVVDEAETADDLPIEMPVSTQNLFSSNESEAAEYDESQEDDDLIEIRVESSAIQQGSAGSDVKTILVVDDSPTIRNLIAGRLQKSGHETVSAIDGVDAVKKLDQIVPDLVLLDISMPKMDGYEVCKVIREDERIKDIPIILISGKDGSFDEEKGEEAGATSFISKPFGPEALMKIVNEHFGVEDYL